MTSISHIAIAVSDINRAINTFTEILGCRPSMIKEVIDHKVKIAFFPGKDELQPCIELVSPIGEDSNIQAFLDKRGEGLHHIALRVSNIEQKMSELKEEGFKMIDEKPRIGARGNKIAFVHPLSCSGVLIELVEE